MPPRKPYAAVLTPLCVAAALLASAWGMAHANSRMEVEQATMAAMIYNFGRFTAWPDSRFSSPNDPVVLCVAPNSPLAGALEALSGKPVGSRTLLVRATTHIDGSCQMAFLADQDARPGYVSALKDEGVLTIGAGAGFARSGAIEFVTIGRQIRFEINQKNALAAGAHLSSNLLRLAVTVY